MELGVSNSVGQTAGTRCREQSADMVPFLALLLELPINIQPTSSKGLGAFAGADIPAGAAVCSYVGEHLRRQQVVERYGAAGGEYLFMLDEDYYIDGAETSHCSRFINHAERGNLLPTPVDDPVSGTRRVDFFATRPIREGEELTFDYGVRYWSARRTDPVAASDSRIATIRMRRALSRVGPWLRNLDGVLHASLPL